MSLEDLEPTERPGSASSLLSGQGNSRSMASLAQSALQGIFGANMDESRMGTPDPTVGAATAAAGRARAATAARAAQLPAPRSRVGVVAAVGALFALGVAYGHLVTHLRDQHYVTPATLDIDLVGSFTLTWGVLGVALGALLPFVDATAPAVLRPREQWTGPADWTSAVRAIGIFIGVSYGIRKLPWTSTLQSATTLALVNPALWFIMDATATGFALSSATAVVGSVAMAVLFPSHLPATTEWTEDYIAVVTWIASVGFCSSVCFGAVGRKLLATAK
ncbi:insulin-induced protein-domain-containing protein [Dipodascopsis tothii]|uniref:insulin-induced protein-domain-containing protein n=1 Tax=Dipodascopsis tothii TaxID=44089 RepID=UPI0034CEA65B